jgi:lipopolysaccharide transport system permease protein
MLVFTLIFNNFMKISTGDIPYPVFVYAGLLPWMYFSSAISNSGNSLLLNGHLISKIYFPRLILPSAAILPGLVDFSIGALLRDDEPAPAMYRRAKGEGRGDVADSE